MHKKGVWRTVPLLFNGGIGFVLQDCRQIVPETPLLVLQVLYRMTRHLSGRAEAKAVPFVQSPWKHFKPLICHSKGGVCIAILPVCTEYMWA
jgi:hypothetical protein